MVKNARIRQSLVYWCLNATEWNWDIHKICEAARSLGCRSVELAPPELWPIVRQYGLENAIAHNGMPDPPFVRGLNNRAYHDELIASTKREMDRCAKAGVPSVIAFTGYKWRDAMDPESGEIPLEEGAANAVKALRVLAEYGAARGVTVCLEQLNSRDDSDPMKGHPGYQGDNLDYCADIVRRVGSERVKLLFDVYHVAIMNGDVIHRLRQYRDLLGHIHTAGVPGRNELGGLSEIHYPSVMRTLVEIGFQGYVGQEFIPTREPVEGLTEAVELCDV